MLDTSRLTLLEQEFEDAVVEETALQRVHATTNAVQQVIVYMVYLESLHRLLVHTLRGIETPGVLSLIRHLRGDKIFVSRMTREGITHQHFRLPTHIHRCCVVVVHTMLYGIVHQLIHLVLIIGQTHHTESQEGYLFTRPVLYAVGHTILNSLFVFLCKSTQRLHGHQGHCRSCADAEPLQKLSTVHV